MTCVWFELLCRIPFEGMRLRLCRRHTDGCPRCRQASESDEVLPPILVSAGQLPDGFDLWPRVQEGIAGLRTPAAGPEAVPLPRRHARNWAYAAAMTVLLLGAGFWIVFSGRQGLQPGPVGERPPQTRLCSAKIGDKPARVFQVQSRNPDRSIFWIAKDDTRS